MEDEEGAMPAASRGADASEATCADEATTAEEVTAPSLVLVLLRRIPHFVRHFIRRMDRCSRRTRRTGRGSGVDRRRSVGSERTHCLVADDCTEYATVISQSLVLGLDGVSPRMPETSYTCDATAPTVAAHDGSGTSLE